MTGKGLIARKAIAGKTIVMMIVRKTTAVMATIKKVIAAMMIVRKAIIVISGNEMTVSDVGTIPMTDRLASIDRIAGSLTTTKPGKPMLSATKTMPPAPIFAMIKITLIPPPICRSPPLMAIQLIWSSASR